MYDECGGNLVTCELTELSSIVLVFDSSTRAAFNLVVFMHTNSTKILKDLWIPFF